MELGDSPAVSSATDGTDETTEGPSNVESRIDALAEAIGALRRSLPGTDVTNRLAAQVDALPDTLAARVGLEASLGTLGVRIGGIGSTIEQARVGQQAAADKTLAKIDEPAWLPGLLARVDNLEQGIARTTDSEPSWLPTLVASVDNLERGIARTTDSEPAWLPTLLAHIDGLEQELEHRDEAAESDRRAVLEGLGALEARLGALEGRLGALDAASGAVPTEVEELAVHVAGAAAATDSLRIALAVQDKRIAEVNAQNEAILAALEKPEDPRLLDELRALADGVAQIVQASSEEKISNDARVRALHAEVASLALVPERLTEIAVILEGLAASPEAAHSLVAATTRLVDVAERLAPEETAVSMTAVFDRMEQRDRSLAARLDRIQQAASQSSGRSDATPGGVDGESIAAAMDGLAAATDDLGALLVATASRLDERMSALEHGPLATFGGGADTAATLALLRAERAMVQARLEEERRLAAEDA